MTLMPSGMAISLRTLPIASFSPCFCSLEMLYFALTRRTRDSVAFRMSLMFSGSFSRRDLILTRSRAISSSKPSTPDAS
jgi:hypothetical protein